MKDVRATDTTSRLSRLQNRIAGTGVGRRGQTERAGRDASSLLGPRSRSARRQLAKLIFTWEPQTREVLTARSHHALTVLVADCVQSSRFFSSSFHDVDRFHGHIRGLLRHAKGFSPGQCQMRELNLTRRYGVDTMIGFPCVVQGGFSANSRFTSR